MPPSQSHYENEEKEVITYMCVYTCVLSHFINVRLFATPWTVACQAPLSMGILQARILEQIVLPSSRGSFRPRYLIWSPPLQTDSLLLNHQGSPMYTHMCVCTCVMHVLVCVWSQNKLRTEPGPKQAPHVCFPTFFFFFFDNITCEIFVP